MPRIAIIGSGFSGLCLGIQLKQAGIHTFTIYEKADRLGGTWRENTYPGAACDVPSFAYCFSFEQKTDWSRKWSPQPEILAYMDACAEKYGILPHVRFQTEIAGARFDEATGVWRLRTVAGEEIEADVLVSGVGQLNRPAIPAIPGLDRFRGAQFHSARWNHTVDLRGKRVAVVGNAASALQFIPEIAPQVEHLIVLQRSANWVVPRFDRAYTPAEQARFRRHPWLTKLYRWWIWLSYESSFPVFRKSRLMSRVLEKKARAYIDAEIADPVLRAKLVPDYPVGAKRMLISDDYYRTLARPNVTVETAGIDRIEPDAVALKDGRRVPVDCLILATGFESTAFLAPMRIEGRGGRTLGEEWAGGAHAYLGLTVAGFPNFFMMYGPNTNLGHNSIIFMIECQTHYVMECLRWMQERGLQWMDLRPEVMHAYNVELQRALAATVWAEAKHSWYKTAEGVITNNWSGSTIRYWWKTRTVDFAAYERRAQSAVARTTVTSAAGGDAAAA